MLRDHGAEIVIADMNRVPPVNDVEDATLDATTELRQPGRRLSCQIPMTDDLDGLVVAIATTQT